MTRVPVGAGRSPLIVCQTDPRFSYYLYVPAAVDRVLVFVHGTDRDAAVFRDALSGFAEDNCCLVLAPLFPTGLTEPGDVDGYKYLLHQGIRYDNLLVEMVAEVATQYGLHFGRFLLGGFSGGAQFAHRFFYLHPQYLLGVSLAAPGRVTLFDTGLDWWAGIRDVPDLFGQAIDWDALRQVPVQIIGGALDADDLTIYEGSPYWMPGANAAGRNRLERMQALYSDFLSKGISAQMTLVSEAGHEGLSLLPGMVTFFEALLDQDSG